MITESILFLFKYVCSPSHPHSVQFSSVPQSCPIICDPMDCSTPGFPVHHELLELTQTHVHHVADAIQPSHPLLSPSLPTFNFSQHQGLFQWVGSSHQIAKVLSFSFSFSPSNEYSRLISIRMDWLDLLALQGLSRVFSNTKIWKYYNTSVLQHSAFFMAHLSHLYMATGKTITFSSGYTNLC